MNIQRLKELLTYDPETGIFTWNICSGNARVGAAAGAIKSNGYITIGIDKKRYHAHRLAWFYIYNEWPLLDIDHINRIKTDNRLCNLRVVSRSENLLNTKVRKDSLSGFNGLYWDESRKRWAVRAWVNGAVKHIARVKTLAEALKLRKNAESAYRGEFNVI
jgi:hypothetical protein